MTTQPKAWLRNWNERLVTARPDGWNDAESAVICSVDGQSEPVTFTYAEFDALPVWSGFDGGGNFQTIDTKFQDILNKG